MKQVLKAAGTIATSNGKIPECLAVKIEGNVCYVTDLENYLIFPNFGGYADGCPDFKQFSKVVNESPICSTSADGSSYLMVNQSGKRFKIPSYSVDNFPNLPNMDNLTHFCNLTSEDVENMKGLVPFTGNDALRIVLTGVSLSNGEMNATNSHFMKWHKTSNHFEGEVIVNKSAIKALSTIGGKWTLMVKHEEKIGVFVSGEIILITRFIDEIYPKYRSVIPDIAHSIKVTLPVNDFLIEIGRKEYQNSTTRRASLSIDDGKVSISMGDIDMGTEYSCSIPAIISSTMEWTGKFNIDFNCASMTDIVKSYPDGLTVDINLLGPSKALVINGNSLLMPFMPQK